MTVSLNGEVQAQLDAHLDAVQRVLAAGTGSRERRRGVMDDLEAQILDMLAAKSEAPTLADLEGVLATLDPPAAYGSVALPKTDAAGAAPAQPQKARLPAALIIGLICIGMSLVPLLIFSALRLFVLPQPASLFPDRDIDLFASHLMNIVAQCLIIGELPLGITGTILGWVSLGQIRNSAGRLRGRGLALFEGLVYPAIAVALLGMQMT